MCDMNHEMEFFTLTEELSFLRNHTDRPPSFPLHSTSHKSGIKPSLRADLAADLCEHTNDKSWTKGKLRPDGYWQAPPCGSGELCAQKGQRKKRKKWKILSSSFTLDISDIGGSQELNWERKHCFRRCKNLRRKLYTILDTIFVQTLTYDDEQEGKHYQSNNQLHLWKVQHQWAANKDTQHTGHTTH